MNGVDQANVAIKIKKRLETLNTKKQHLHEDILSVNLFYLPSLTKNILLICIEKNKKRGGGG